MGGFLEYVPGDSFIHTMNPVAKLAFALLVSIACFVSGSIVFLVAMVVLGFALAGVCGMTRQTLGLAKAVAVFSVILSKEYGGDEKTASVGVFLSTLLSSVTIPLLALWV